MKKLTENRKKYLLKKFEKKNVILKLYIFIYLFEDH